MADNGITDAGGADIAQLLKHSPQITDLDLTENTVRLRTCTALAEALLPRISNLKRLLLKRNGLGDKECCALAAGLPNNTTVTILDISHNHIGPRGAAAIGAAISENSTLEVCPTHAHTSFRLCSLNWQCGQMLMQAWYYWPLHATASAARAIQNAAQEVNLSWNPLRPKGGVAIAKGAAPHVKLQVLDLSWCGLQDEGASALGPCCQVSQVRQMAFRYPDLHTKLHSQRLVCTACRCGIPLQQQGDSFAHRLDAKRY